MFPWHTSKFCCTNYIESFSFACLTVISNPAYILFCCLFADDTISVCYTFVMKFWKLADISIVVNYVKYNYKNWKKYSNVTVRCKCHVDMRVNVWCCSSFWIPSFKINEFFDLTIFYSILVEIFVWLQIGVILFCSIILQLSACCIVWILSQLDYVLVLLRLKIHFKEM